MTEQDVMKGQTNAVDYIFLPGGEQKLLLIKTGLGGSAYGYRGKYLRIAQHFQSFGHNVLCCTTPRELSDRDSFETAIDIAKTMLGDRFSSCTIHYMGVSRGAYQGLLYGNTVPQIGSFLLINPPLAVNFLKQLEMLQATDKRCVLVVGTKDPSFQYWPWVCLIENPKLEMVEASGADHQFRGMDEEFFKLPAKVFLPKSQD